MLLLYTGKLNYANDDGINQKRKCFVDHVFGAKFLHDMGNHGSLQLLLLFYINVSPYNLLVSVLIFHSI